MAIQFSLVPSMFLSPWIALMILASKVSLIVLSSGGSHPSTSLASWVSISSGCVLSLMVTDDTSGVHHWLPFFFFPVRPTIAEIADPEGSNYAGVVSRESVRIAFTYAALNDLDIWAFRMVFCLFHRPCCWDLFRLPPAFLFLLLWYSSLAFWIWAFPLALDLHARSSSYCSSESLLNSLPCYLSVNTMHYFLLLRIACSW